MRRYAREDDKRSFLLSYRAPVCPNAVQQGGTSIKAERAEGLLVRSAMVHPPGAGVVFDGTFQGKTQFYPVIIRKVSVYLQRGSFPSPEYKLASGPVWTREQIEEFRDNQAKS